MGEIKTDGLAVMLNMQYMPRLIVKAHGDFCAWYCTCSRISKRVTSTNRSKLAVDRRPVYIQDRSPAKVAGRVHRVRVTISAPAREKSDSTGHLHEDGVIG